jgi:hypothetical protein
MNDRVFTTIKGLWFFEMQYTTLRLMACEPIFSEKFVEILCSRGNQRFSQFCSAFEGFYVVEEIETMVLSFCAVEAIKASDNSVVHSRDSM